MPVLTDVIAPKVRMERRLVDGLAQASRQMESVATALAMCVINNKLIPLL